MAETVAERTDNYVVVVVVVVVLKKSERRSRGPLCPDLA